MTKDELVYRLQGAEQILGRVEQVALEQIDPMEGEDCALCQADGWKRFTVGGEDLPVGHDDDCPVTAIRAYFAKYKVRV